MTLLIMSLSGLALLFAMFAILRLRRGHWLRACGDGTLGLVCLLLAGAAGAVATHLHTYARLTHEQPAGELAFTRTGHDQYEAVFRLADGSARVFDLQGDEWQVDARILKWHGLGNLLGLDAGFRLERISGRHSDIRAARVAAPSVHGLGEEAGLDVWKLAQRHPGGCRSWTRSTAVPPTCP
jgi:hypothetical protein